MSNPFVDLLIGLPGVGKSTYCRNMYPNVPVTSSDSFIEQIAANLGQTYDEVFRENIELAETYFREDVLNYLASGTSFIVDRTNLTAKGRNRILEWVRQENSGRDKQDKFEVRATVFTGAALSMRDWLTQLDRPGKNIPVNVLIQMSKQFTEPSQEEGFQVFTYISGRDY